MRITCPCCGERSLDEFSYYGDATVARPDALGPEAGQQYYAYVFERTNSPGDHRELWYHAAGCHAWLVITRNVSNHAISQVELAKDVALKRNAQVTGQG